MNVALLMNRSLNATNATFVTRPSIPYPVITVVSVLCAATIAYNILFIYAFVKDAAIRSPFTYYLLNVSICDLGLALFSMSGFIWFNVSPRSSAAYCPYYNFLAKHLFIGAGCAVMLVSIDRLLSMFAPVHYKNIRSVKCTCVACVVMWLLIVALTAPYIVMDALWYNRMTLPCAVNFGAQRTYALVVEILAYDLPPLFVLSSYVVIFTKLFRRMLRKRGNRVLNAPSNSLTFTAAISKPEASAYGTGETVADIRSTKQKHHNERRMFSLFALLALCVLICFIPPIIYFLVADFTGYWNVTLFHTCIVLEYLSCVFNPLIYHASLPEVQKLLKDCFRNNTACWNCRCCCLVGKFGRLFGSSSFNYF
ncbi:melatonin-related receptor-like isoform X1 [Paramacrobiotus metropolitanus]|uniref:melatonin-related receptor-like isoform X1 n=1 Tax=Paramacrobiotus metropolitanus TaxID=2943436 RepID=UPI002445D462|nr:melatonin-related receptor-like isoform X1 [Paramacrobiotus metropolitanus]